MPSSRVNSESELLASATRTGKTTETIELPNQRGLIVVVDVTATSGDGTEDLAVKVLSLDPVTGKTQDVLSDEFTDGATGTRFYLMYPGATSGASAFDVVEEVPPGRRVSLELETLQGGTSPDHTYSVGIIKVV